MADTTTIPADLLAKLNAAEASLQQAASLDAAHEQAHQAMLRAQHDDDEAAAVALAAHQQANQAAGDALAAVKTHFGIT